MEKLLEQSKQELLKPFRQSRRILLVILNICYIVIISFHLIFIKATTGLFAPHPLLYYIYIVPIFIHFLSLIYNINVLQCRENEFIEPKEKIKKLFEAYSRKIDLFMGWFSITSIMLANFCNLTGLGNSSNDAIFSDYILSCSLIIAAVIIIGRRAALVWTLIVVSTLFWDVSRLGFNYEYHYLTPTEATQYKEGLKKNDPIAIQRKAELEKNGLNPPQLSRYFIDWLIYIVISLMAAYFFSGITLDILKIIPSVVSNIEKAIHEGTRMKKENENTLVRLNRYVQITDELNAEIEKLDFHEKKKLIGVINIMKQAVSYETDLEITDAGNAVFLKFLNDNYTALNHEEITHLVYLRMNLLNPQIARLMGVKMESLRIKRHRLKKKLGLEDEVDLKELIEKIEKSIE